MRARDFGKTHTAHFNAEDFAQTRACNPEAAFTGLIDFNNRNAGKGAAQSTGIDIVTGDTPLAVTARLPVPDQHLMGLSDTRKNILLTHNLPPPR